MFKSVQKGFPNWQQIKVELSQLKNKTLSAQNIRKQLIQFKYYSNLARRKNAEKETLKFTALMDLYAKQLPQIYSKVANFVLNRSKQEVPVFRIGENKEQKITKQKILYLYCSMLLMLIPPQLFDQSHLTRSKFNYLMDFSYIFDEQPYKVKTVIEYIKQEIDKKENYNQTFIIRRNVQKRNIEHIIQESKEKPMCEIKMESNTASIEDYYGYLKADFANKFLGGGALMSGCVQQEIMFANHPECFTAQLLCEVMQPNESIHLFGFKKYSKNLGYGWDLSYDGQQTHKYSYDQNKMAKQYITAIDAIHFAGSNVTEQFTKKLFDRELLKAFVGFNTKEAELKQVVTGNWGCGCFNGDLRLKFLIQWLACSLVGKKMIYCPFGSREIINDQELIQKMKEKKIDQNYQLLIKACEKVPKGQKDINIYSIIHELI